MKESKKNKLKIILVLSFTIIIMVGMYMSYRANYLQTLEVGEEYLSVFFTNISSQYKIMFFHFILFFIIIFIQNLLIKRGLKPFFKDEEKELPKLPNKSLAYVLAGIISIAITHLFTEKFINFSNAIWLGKSDPIFNLDIGFFFFQKPFIQLVLIYAIGVIIFTSLYMLIYYIAVFNIYLKGIDKELFKKSILMKQLRINALILILFIAGLVFLNTYDIVYNHFLTLRDSDSTKIVGAGLADVTIRLWGHRILAIIIAIAGFFIIKNIGKTNFKKIIIYILIVPIYLVFLFVIILLFSLVFVNNNKLDKEQKYIGYHIDYTKAAYNLNIVEEELENADTVTKQDLTDNNDIVNNITLINPEITLDTLESLQTNYGYYTYRTTKLHQYMINQKETAVYISPREVLSSSDASTYNNKTYEYTHGYGAIVSYASKVTSNGNVEYVQKNLDSSDKQILVSEPRIYFGTETNHAIITNSNHKTEFDYPINSTNIAEYTYSGTAGIKTNLIDRIILSIMKRDVNIAFSSNLTENSKVIMNRNVVDRAKLIMPYFVYDENPYLVITDEGRQVWVLDGYTVSNNYPYAQKTVIEVNGAKKEINYIRNSVKVLIDAYDGTTTFYIMDSSDPMMMVYSKIYPNIFKNKDEIPQDIVKHFSYPEYLYNVQSKLLKYYHNITEDVLYRGNDVWDYITYSPTKVAGSDIQMKPYYTMIKVNNGENKIGLIIPYTLDGKQNIVSYLLGTISNEGNLNLTLYKYAQGSNVIGPKQLERVIEEDETISKEIETISVTGTKIIKDLIIVPINHSLLYVEPIYQQQLNEKNAIPLLKKVIVASANKVTIGDSLKEALESLISQSATNIKVENTDTMNDLINTIIDANQNLKESTQANDYEMIGKDINKLQDLIEQLQQMQEENQEKYDSAVNNTVSSYSQKIIE